MTVAAAASAKFAFEEIGARFEEETGVPVTFIFASTGTLAQQVENGAPYDVFAAADLVSIQRLVGQGSLLADTQQVYARGRLALVVNRASGLQLTGLDGLATPAVTRIAIANPQHAPYGRAAQEALIAAGLWESLRERLVWAENVRQALQFVQSGDAPVGLVALAIAEVPEVDYMLISDDLHAPIEQAIAVSSRATQPESARRFVQFVTGPEGRQILGRYGYQLLGE